MARIHNSPESRRLEEERQRLHNWKRWGPYLSERQWGTVREDYSADGSCWDYFPHDHARSRTYRWGEDGLLGFTDRECRLCFSLCLWNGEDPILKERLFGLAGDEGNHGEDVKECYFFLDSTPTHSYSKALYKYPQKAFPYNWLVEENVRRSKSDPEFELLDTNIFDDNAYFDVFVEYAKNTPDDVLIKVTINNRAATDQTVQFLPNLWFRNTWDAGSAYDKVHAKPELKLEAPGLVSVQHETLGRYFFAFDSVSTTAIPGSAGVPPALKKEAGRMPALPAIPLFTENETNYKRIFDVPNNSRYVKDAFHEYVINKKNDAVNPEMKGTKFAPLYSIEIPAQDSVVINMRLFSEKDRPTQIFQSGFEEIISARKNEADDFYNADEVIHDMLTPEEKLVARQAYAGLLWTKQFYHYVVPDWLEGDHNESTPPPPPERKEGRNKSWVHVYNRDIISMPDSWEYPWFAAWDLAFQMIPFSDMDPQFAKNQMILLLREWYMHPNGQIPAYEFKFSDVNPPVHAWAAWHIYKSERQTGKPDRQFLESVFQKLMLNFTWWVNRKDFEGNNLFGGGFLGLDNIGVFDRSQQLPTGGHLEQADGTAWMAFYCLNMLRISIELAQENPVYEDMASKFFEHFVAITDAMNSMGGTGLWDDEDGFYYDQIKLGDDDSMMLKTRSLVGLLPLIAVHVFDESKLKKLPNFYKRMQWFLSYRSDLSQCIAYAKLDNDLRLLAIPSKERLARILKYLLDEDEFFSPHGIRSLSAYHRDHPYIFSAGGVEHIVEYVPNESDSGLFGGNSNWRGPVWFPLNYLIIESLLRYHHFYGESLLVECPTNSGKMMTLEAVSQEIAKRLSNLFIPDAHGRRPCNGGEAIFDDPNWKDLVLFYEYFNPDTGKGLGASHQTGWTALVADLMARDRWDSLA